MLTDIQGHRLSTVRDALRLRGAPRTRPHNTLFAQVVIDIDDGGGEGQAGWRLPQPEGRDPVASLKSSLLSLCLILTPVPPGIVQ